MEKFPDLIYEFYSTVTLINIRSDFCEDFEADFARPKQLKPSESYFHDAEQPDGDSEI